MASKLCGPLVASIYLFHSISLDFEITLPCSMHCFGMVSIMGRPEPQLDFPVGAPVGREWEPALSPHWTFIGTEQWWGCCKGRGFLRCKESCREATEISTQMKPVPLSKADGASLSSAQKSQLVINSPPASLTHYRKRPQKLWAKLQGQRKNAHLLTDYQLWEEHQWL